MDSSDQSADTVRYIGSLFPEGRANVTLFHVMDLFPESFLDLQSGQDDQRQQISGMRDWEFTQKTRIRGFMDEAVKQLIGNGYREEDVSVIVEDRIVDLTRDIAQKGRLGYAALVMGRSGINFIESMILDSIQSRLIGLLSQLPVWILGGNPDPSKILIAVDSSKGTERALSYVGKIFPYVSPKILLLHVSRRSGMIEPELRQFIAVHEGRDWMERSNVDLELGEGGMESYLLKCVSIMERRGTDRGRIEAKVVYEAKSVSEAVMKEARDGNYGTIILGRRDLSKIDEMIRGRISNQILQITKDRAVWVVH